jgi:hypothetical protein
MGSGCCKFQGEETDKCARVGREDEGTSSNRPELGAVVSAPDAEILRDIVCLLTQRVRAGRASFLLKVKSHRGEPINERAGTLAEKGREISGDHKRWDDRTDRMTFKVQKGNATVHSVWTNSVQTVWTNSVPSEGKRGGLNCKR